MSRWCWCSSLTGKQRCSYARRSQLHRRFIPVVTHTRNGRRPTRARIHEADCEVYFSLPSRPPWGGVMADGCVHLMALVKATKHSVNDAVYNRLISCHAERKRMVQETINYPLLRHTRATCSAAQMGCPVAPVARIDSERLAALR